MLSLPFQSSTQPIFNEVSLSDKISKLFTEDLFNLFTVSSTSLKFDEDNEDIPYIFDELFEQPSSIKAKTEITYQQNKLSPLKEYQEHFYSTMKETSDYLEKMIDNLFLQREITYMEESLSESNIIHQENRKSPIKSIPFPKFESVSLQENRENVDPMGSLIAKNIKPEFKEAKNETLKEILSEEDQKKDICKLSLLSRIQNSLKDLTTSNSDKTQENLDPSSKKKEELSYYLKYINEKSHKSEDEKPKLIQTNSILSLKMSNTKSVLLQNKKKPVINGIRDLLNVSKTSIKYGTVLPGYIMEDDLEIQNKSMQNLSIKITIVCHNSELDDHDEYIYSIRKLNIYDYNEKITSVITPHSTAKYKIALKVPNLKNPCLIKGSVVIALQGIESNIDLPICANVEIPEIYCPKEIFDNQNSCSVIKFAMKKGKKQDCKIPFKNGSGMNVCLEFEFIEPEEKNKYGYDLLNYPNTINIGPNGIAILNVILKPILNVINEMQGDNEIRRVLLAKIKNSSMIYYFPLSITIY